MFLERVLAQQPDKDNPRATQKLVDANVEEQESHHEECCRRAIEKGWNQKLHVGLEGYSRHVERMVIALVIVVHVVIVFRTSIIVVMSFLVIVVDWQETLLFTITRRMMMKLVTLHTRRCVVVLDNNDG